MSDGQGKLQHELMIAQCALAEAEARLAQIDAEHQKASAKEFEETCKKIEQAHQEWEAALDVVEDPIFMHDKDFRILRCNRAYQRCAGVPFKQIIGRPYYDFFPKSHAPLPSCLRAIKKTNEKEEEEVAVGDLIYRSRSCSINDEHGTYLYSVHTLEDITERRRSDQSLHESESRLRTVMESVQTGIVIIDPVTHKIVDVNAAAASMIGAPKEKITGSLCHRFICPAEVGKCPITDLNQTVDHSERVLLTATGSSSPIIKSVTTVLLDGKEHLLESFIDISEIKKSEAELLRINRVLKTLSEGNHIMLHANDELELMKNICEVITTNGDYELAWIGLARQDEYKSIEVMVVAGSDKEYANALQLSWDDCPAGHGPTGTAMRTGQTQITQDILNDPRMDTWREAATKHGYASSIALPLKANEKTFGTLSIYATQPHAFNTDEVTLLEEVASDLAFGIVNLRTGAERDQAIKERQHYVERLRASLEETLQAIAATVEMRDPYTAGHQRRVADLAVAISQEMHLPESQIHGIHLAGIVHDLGKIHLPAEILSKPGHLSEIEFSLIKTHAQKGYDILKGIEFPWPIAQAVLQHHERMDGSGYPQGLNDGQIILEAKILAVADVVEAITSHRPYRPSLGKDVALNEIRKNRGVLYAPEVVDACIKLFIEKKYHIPEL